MYNRRRFLQGIAAAATAPSMLQACNVSSARPVGLQADPDRILDLAEGLSYSIISRAGDAMSDGLQVPGSHDGMAAFAGKDGRVRLVCNHEIGPGSLRKGAFGADYGNLPEEISQRLYDAGDSKTPGCGGTTTTIYNPRTGTTEKQFLSLGGTEVNCAGGPTPWGSWLSCEECFESPGTQLFPPMTREQRHGYVFEVPAGANGLVDARPIKAMGRFEHEACAVDDATGIVYMTEDRHHSLFYRYIPDIPGDLGAGGRLQALAIDGRPSLRTHNWSGNPDIRMGVPLHTRWIDLDNVDPVENNLRLRGAAKGAATFARGEGLCNAGDRFAFTCTIGGPARLGQVFTYKPSPREGTDAEQEQAGQIELIAESSKDSLLRNADNLTMAPWGDLIVCEDTSNHCGLVGIRSDGSQYAIADNPYSNSELAGVCFSPDSKILFVNIQYPGATLAITGDWPV